MHQEDSYAVFSGDDSDPVSSGKYIGTFVFTAPVAEPTVMSFTVPLDDCIIVATTIVLTSYSSSPECSGLRECLRRDVVWWFTPGGAYDSVWDSVKPMTGNYLFNYFQYQEVVGCVCMLNGWFSSNDTICADNYIYFRFKLQACVAVRSGSCICTAILPSWWTVIVWKCCPGVCLRLGSSPSLATDHTIFVLCRLLSVAWV